MGDSIINIVQPLPLDLVHFGSIRASSAHYTASTSINQQLIEYRHSTRIGIPKHTESIAHNI